MGNEKREALELFQLARGRDFLAEALKGIDAAIAAPEILEHAEERIKEAKELPGKVAHLKAKEESLLREIENKQAELDRLQDKMQKAEADWQALKKMANG